MVDAIGFVYSQLCEYTYLVMSDSEKTKKSKLKGTRRTFYIDKEAYEKVKEDAEEQDRSASYIINAILKEYYKLTKRKKKD